MKVLNREYTSKSPLVQLIKYALVGVMNTLLTLSVIFVCKSLLGVNDYVSNALGYIAGVVNSFLWNRKWVFRSHGGLSRQAVHFLVGFAICYCIQFAIVWLMNQSWFGDTTYTLLFGFVISGYGIATLIGNVCYTLSNFVYNRLVTFKEKDED